MGVRLLKAKLTENDISNTNMHKWNQNYLHRQIPLEGSDKLSCKLDDTDPLSQVVRLCKVGYHLNYSEYIESQWCQ